MAKKNIDMKAERKRIKSLMIFEEQARKTGYQYIAGIDEAGRGPLAGPVVAAAVILPDDFFLAGVNDSKKVSASKREQLIDNIKKEARSWAVAAVFPPYLDSINILNATREAMKLAIAQLNPVPDYLLIDALRLEDITIKQNPIIKGDSLSISIACASILAKVERDRIMQAFDRIYPGYGFATHKGYATRAHLEALAAKGVCGIHRESFEPVKTMLITDRIQPNLFG